jgi:hypothetical protein
MKIIDLVKNNYNDELWSQCLAYIKSNCQQDVLYENYIVLDKKDFISLPVAIIDNKIVAFSGAQFRPTEWGHNIARISSRFWIHPEYRRHTLSKFEDHTQPWYNSEFLIKCQIEEVNRLGIPHMFISREGNYKKSFQKYINLVNKYNETNFRLMDEYYLIQKTPQLIAVHSKDNIDQIIKEETLFKKV